MVLVLIGIGFIGLLLVCVCWSCTQARLFHNYVCFYPVIFLTISIIILFVMIICEVFYYRAMLLEIIDEKTYMIIGEHDTSVKPDSSVEPLFQSKLWGRRKYRNYIIIVKTDCGTYMCWTSPIWLHWFWLVIISNNLRSVMNDWRLSLS